ncbi:unnamed protein product [Cuscuta epithymum]|uniref:DUF1990 domain-containing protein n=1 Tax=Cuscuta epithymum TaxID=186058 RepID=A0AAV0FDD6_9ASTE|nr:unnamed protein product [Cuscuta epithymum]
MEFVSWNRPSREDQKKCLDKCATFNYDAEYRGATAYSLKQDTELTKRGFFLNHSRVLVGSGSAAFEKGKKALQTWRHFSLNWTFVDPKSRIGVGEKFCVCVKEFLPWVMMPLQVLYVHDQTINKDKGMMASFSFGSGTLQGHLLAGEERFSISLDENDKVWYEILSISKPAHFLSFVGYPYVLLRQKSFAHQSSNAVRKYLGP